MVIATAAKSKSLQISRHYNTSREQIFAAWTNADALGKWFGPPSHQCSVEKMDVHEGGEYQIRMKPTGEDGDCSGDSSRDSICGGRFVELVSPEKIVMTFSWLENGSDIGETTLTIELSEAGDGTDLVLTHTGLPDEEAVKAHDGGWNGSLDGLQSFLQA
jgi:uncharacterized protein YndB with AHSA1/START domain